MIARLLALGLVFALALGAIDAGPAAAASREPSVELTMSRTLVNGSLGDSFRFSSRIQNTGRATLRDLVAHLNVVSLTKGVYVDPEDWSSQRTHYLPPLAPGQSTDVPWTVEAVNGGRFAVYVVVLPGERPATALQGPAVSPALEAHVSERKTINSGGVLPLALGVPALLGLSMVAVRVRRSR